MKQMVFKPEQRFLNAPGYAHYGVRFLLLCGVGLALSERQFVVAAVCFLLVVVSNHKFLDWFFYAQLWEEMELVEDRLLLRRHGAERVVEAHDIEELGEAPDYKGRKTLFLTYYAEHHLWSHGEKYRIRFEASDEGREFLRMIVEIFEGSIDYRLNSPAEEPPSEPSMLQPPTS